MYTAFGAKPFGLEPLAGDPLHDPVSVVTAPIGSITSGGPDMTVGWTFSQPQGDAQAEYRVLITNDARTTTYYDSGWLPGSANSHVIDVDEEGIPHESTDVTAVIQTRGPEAIGTGVLSRYQAEDPDAFEIHYGAAHCTITAPVAGITTDLSKVSVAWTFSDDDGANIQAEYRVRLLVEGTGLVLWDTGWVVSTDTTYEIPAILSHGTEYRVEVQLKNNHGIRSD